MWFLLIRTVFLPAIFSLVFLSNSSAAAELNSVRDSDIGCTAVLSGEITPDDAGRVSTWLDTVTESDGKLRLCFDSPGGSYLGGVALARALLEKHHNVGTGVDEGAVCASACALAFMAGRHDRFEDRPTIPDRVLHPSGGLGFHSPFLVAPDDVYSADDVNSAYELALIGITSLLELRREYPDYAFGETLLIEMLRTAPRDMTWVETVRQAARWDITIAPVPLPDATNSSLAFETLNPPQWGPAGSFLHPWKHAMAQVCLSELVRGDFAAEVVIPNVRYEGSTSRGEAFQVEYIYGKSGGTCDFHLYPTPTSPWPNLPDWSIGQISVNPSWLGEVAQTDRELAAYLAYPLDTLIRDLPVRHNAASVSENRIALLKRALVTMPPFTSCLPNPLARVINVEDFTNLRTGAGLSNQIITRVPKGSSVSVQGRVLYFATNTISDRCFAACNGPNGRFADQNTALQCIDRNEIWLEVRINSGPNSGQRGFLSRKFLE